MNSTAINYNSTATQDDGTCQYEIEPVDQCADVFCDACPAGWITLSAEEGECCPSCQEPSENNQTTTTDLDNDSQTTTTDSEDKSSLTDFARTGLVVAVFCGLVVLLITTIRKR